MRYLSLFSGIEAATTAWHPLGWTCVAVAEIEPFPCAVLAHHYPDTQNLGNVTQVDELDIAMLGPIDLIVFGSPCQDLSVAGKRKGLAGERSGLFHTAINIVEWARKHCGLRWALWENVPGAFSSNQGRDFASVVESLAGLDGQPVPPKGWGTEGCAVGSEAMVEWAVLDAQWFGVAQRRRRVFALADFGDWASRPPVLLEPQGLRGDSAPSRETGQSVAACVTTGTGQRYDPETETILPVGGLGVAHTLRASGFNASEDGTGRGTPLVPMVHIPTMPTLRAGSPSNGAGHGARSGDCKDEYIVPVAFHHNTQACQLPGPERDASISDSLTCSQQAAVAFAVALRGREGGGTAELGNEVQNCLRASGGGGDKPHVLAAMQVRRLTPRECERLQGFPDDYTLIAVRGKPAADGPRYKALGNSMAVPVMQWIGRQVQTAHNWDDLI